MRFRILISVRLLGVGGLIVVLACIFDVVGRVLGKLIFALRGHTIEFSIIITKSVIIARWQVILLILFVVIQKVAVSLPNLFSLVIPVRVLFCWVSAIGFGALIGWLLRFG